MSVRVLDPTAQEESQASGITLRLTSLAGRTVGLLDNSKINVQPFLDHVEDILRSRHGVRNVVRLRKADASRPAPAEIVAGMSKCHALISAVGD
jgi:hypothetical protein